MKKLVASLFVVLAAVALVSTWGRSGEELGQPPTGLRELNRTVLEVVPSVELVGIPRLTCSATDRTVTVTLHNDGPGDIVYETAGSFGHQKMNVRVFDSKDTLAAPRVACGTGRSVKSERLAAGQTLSRELSYSRFGRPPQLGDKLRADLKVFVGDSPVTISSEPFPRPKSWDGKRLQPKVHHRMPLINPRKVRPAKR